MLLISRRSLKLVDSDLLLKIPAIGHRKTSYLIQMNPVVSEELANVWIHRSPRLESGEENGIHIKFPRLSLKKKTL